jgi:hypothetical protein
MHPGKMRKRGANGNRLHGFFQKRHWRTNSETGAFLGVPATQSQSTLKKPLVRLQTSGND